MRKKERMQVGRFTYRKYRVDSEGECWEHVTRGTAGPDLCKTTKGRWKLRVWGRTWGLSLQRRVFDTPFDALRAAYLKDIEVLEAKFHKSLKQAERFDPSWSRRARA